MSAVLEENVKQEEVVYSPDMAKTQPPNSDLGSRVAVLNERLGTAITFTKWVGGVAGVAIVGVAIYFNQKLVAHGETLAAMQQQLESIQKEQSKTIPALIAEALKNPSPDNLKAVARVLASSRNLDKKSDPDLLASAGQALYRLAASPMPPANVWPASAQLVSYRSEQSNTSVTAQVPDCFVNPPSGSEVKLLPDHKTFQITGRQIYRNCMLNLDKSPQAFNFPGGVVFQDCFVRYSGGPPRVYGSVEFRNCFFLLEASDDIQNSGRQLVLTLLKAPNLSSVDVVLPSS